jgi:cysteine-rich repeat protein
MTEVTYKKSNEATMRKIKSIVGFVALLSALACATPDTQITDESSFDAAEGEPRDVSALLDSDEVEEVTYQFDPNDFTPTLPIIELDVSEEDFTLLHLNNGCPRWSIGPSCNDGNACTTYDTCIIGYCVGLGRTKKDDRNVCTTDSCHPTSGVSNVPINIDDNNACTVDVCDPITGTRHDLINFNDNNACTADSCNPASGVSNVPINFDDNNICTADSCDPLVGQAHVPIDSDGDGTADCDDNCPIDPEKIEPGLCGCGIEDIDADADGIGDCIDECPLDTFNDEDNDGLCGDVDNCPFDPNSNQLDSDVDGEGNACDLTPFGICGDGLILGLETCDDGNTLGNDGCNAFCQIELCGDGVIDALEECDDNNIIDTDNCTNLCKNARCGDGSLQSGVEQCDDGNLLSNDGCNSSCIVEFCGDGIVQSGINEECDDNNIVSNDGCSKFCDKEFCGDGVVNARDKQIFLPTSGVLAEFEFEGNTLDTSGNQRDAVLLGGSFVPGLFGQALKLSAVGAMGLDWSNFASSLVHPYSIEMVLTPEQTLNFAKLFSSNDALDQGWYYASRGFTDFPTGILGQGLMLDNQRHYLAFVSTSATTMNAFFQGNFLGAFNTSFIAPPPQAIFFRDDSISTRREQVLGVIEGLRMSEVARSTAEIAQQQRYINSPAFEECDDGNLINGDGCSSICTL